MVIPCSELVPKSEAIDANAALTTGCGTEALEGVYNPVFKF